MKVFTEKSVLGKRCPHCKERPYCVGSECMGWVETFQGSERENHSGGKEFMIELAHKYGVSSKDLEYSESALKCDQIITLPPIGYCGANNYRSEDLNEN